ncbi:HAD family hydrolase [Streptomyces sp. NRRL S-646]|uniref:HAD family hydrolase n=1 Tax=Streptomyces sp. NRRL S-646 TaxID=1463917 RepID=UPI0013313431|nr:HAD hydrolase family protein [Streptomyces sp. NRRL S-646]
MTAPDRAQLVCTDLDGTLLNSAGAVGPVTRKALTEAAACRVPVVCVTGRPLRDALVVGRELGSGGLVGCSNGAVMAEIPSGRVLMCRGFSADRAGFVLQQLRGRLPDIVLGVDTLRGLFLEEDFAALVPHCWRHDVVINAGSSLASDDRVVKILAVHPTVPARTLADLLIQPSDALTGTCSTPHFLEMSPNGVDKGASLRWLANHHRLRLTATVAVGDMPNDLPMLRAAGLAAAVSNAHRDVRRAADLILPSNDEEGVADLITMVCRMDSKTPPGARSTHTGQERDRAGSG